MLPPSFANLKSKMASLPLPCSQLSSQRPNRLLAKPSPDSQTRPRPQFQVRCNAQDDNNQHPRLDRRNLLVGMGGLYGATNLDSPASASPISAPDLSKCTRPTDLFTNQPLDVNCCPPLSESDLYKLPPVQTMRIRPAAHLASQDYIDKYKKAVDLMKALPDNDPRNFKQQANVHCAYCNLTYPQTGDSDSDLKLQIHNCWFFYPWHRWYLYFYERILGKLINDPTFGLPFWNWDHPAGMYLPNIFDKEGASLYDDKRNQAHRPGAGITSIVDLRYAGTDNPDRPIEETIDRNLQEMYQEIISNAKRLYDFYGARYVTGTPNNPGEGVIERGSHTAIHRWVGDPRQPIAEDMGNFYSAGRDPIFFSHHANIDRLWSVYRETRAGMGKPMQFSSTDWLDANFVFYDENKKLVNVKVADALDNEAMGYTYQKVDLPWLKYREERARSDKKPRKAAPTPARKAVGKPAFPVRLEKIVRVLVDRPKKSRSKKDKEKEEELLLIEGIEVDTAKFVRFEVYINDEDDKPNEVTEKAEYVGCYSQVPHKSSGKGIKTKIRLGLSEVLEDLDADDDDQVLVSLVPLAGGADVTIGGIKIIYDDMDVA